MRTKEGHADRIALLEADIRRRDEMIRELVRERDATLDLVNRMREQAEDQHQLIEGWKDADRAAVITAKEFYFGD